MSDFAGVARARELHRRESGHRIGQSGASARSEDGKARPQVMVSPYFKNPGDDEGVASRLKRKAKLLGDRLVQMAQSSSPREPPHLTPVSPPFLKRSMALAACDTGTADLPPVVNDPEAAVHAPSMQPFQLLAKNNKSVQDNSLLHVNDPKVRHRHSDDNSSIVSEETCFSGSTNSQKKKPKCWTCGALGQVFMPLSKCSACPRRFHDKCGNPRPCDVKSGEVFVCMHCIKKDTSRTSTSLPLIEDISTTLTSSKAVTDHSNTSKRSPSPVAGASHVKATIESAVHLPTTDMNQDFPFKASPILQHHRQESPRRLDKDVFVDQTHASSADLDAVPSRNHITTRGNNDVAGMKILNVPTAPAAMRKVQSPGLQKITPARNYVDSYRPESSPPQIPSRAMDSYRPPHQPQPPPLRTVKERERFLRYAPESERISYLRENRKKICKEITCPHWRASHCRLGTDCMYAHKDTQSYFPSPARPAKKWTCFHWLNGQCHFPEVNCHFAHYDTGLYADAGGMASKKHITCFWWNKLFCRKDASVCEFAHYQTGTTAADPGVPPRKRSGLESEPRFHRPQESTRHGSDSWRSEDHTTPGFSRTVRDTPRSPVGSSPRRQSSTELGSPLPQAHDTARGELNYLQPTDRKSYSPSVHVRETPLSPVELSASESEGYEPPPNSRSPPAGSRADRCATSAHIQRHLLLSRSATEPSASSGSEITTFTANGEKLTSTTKGGFTANASRLTDTDHAASSPSLHISQNTKQNSESLPTVPQVATSAPVAVPKQYARRGGTVNFGRSSDPRRRKLDSSSNAASHINKDQVPRPGGSEVQNLSPNTASEVKPKKAVRCQGENCGRLIMSTSAYCLKCQQQLKDTETNMNTNSESSTSPAKLLNTNLSPTPQRPINKTTGSSHITETTDPDVTVGDLNMGTLFSKNHGTSSHFPTTAAHGQKRVASASVSGADAMFLPNKRTKMGPPAFLRAAASAASRVVMRIPSATSLRSGELAGPSLSISELTELETLRKEFEEMEENQADNDLVTLRLLRAKKKTKLAELDIRREEDEAAEREQRRARIRAENERMRKEEADELADFTLRQPKAQERERSRVQEGLDSNSRPLEDRETIHVASMTKASTGAPRGNASRSPAPPLGGYRATPLATSILGPLVNASAVIELLRRVPEADAGQLYIVKHICQGNWQAEDDLSVLIGELKSRGKYLPLQNTPAGGPNGRRDWLDRIRGLVSALEKAGFAATTPTTDISPAVDSRATIAAADEDSDIPFALSDEENNVDINPSLTGPRSNLGPKRVACESCRQRRIKCRHYIKTTESGVVRDLSLGTSAIPASVLRYKPPVRSPSLENVPPEPRSSGEDGSKGGSRLRACPSCQKNKRKCVHDPITGETDLTRLERAQTHTRKRPRLRPEESLDLKRAETSVPAFEPMFSSIVEGIQATDAATNALSHPRSVISRKTSGDEHRLPTKSTLENLDTSLHAYLPRKSESDSSDINDEIDHEDGTGNKPTDSSVAKNSLSAEEIEQSRLACGNCGLLPPTRLRRFSVTSPLLCVRCYRYRQDKGVNRPLDDNETHQRATIHSLPTDTTNDLNQTNDPHRTGFVYFLKKGYKSLTVECVHCGWKTAQNSTRENEHRYDCKNANVTKGLENAATQSTPNVSQKRHHEQEREESDVDEAAESLASVPSLAKGIKAAKALALAAASMPITPSKSVAPDEIQALFYRPLRDFADLDGLYDKATSLSIHSHENEFSEGRHTTSKRLRDKGKETSFPKTRAEEIERDSVESGSENGWSDLNVYELTRSLFRPFTLIHNARYEQEPDPRLWVDDQEDDKFYAFDLGATKRRIAARPDRKANVKARKNGTRPGMLLAMSDWRNRIRKYGSLHRETDRNPGAQKKGTFLREVADPTKLTLQSGLDDLEIEGEEVEGTMQEFLDHPTEVVYDLLDHGRLTAARTLAFRDVYAKRGRVPDSEKFPVGRGG